MNSRDMIPATPRGQWNTEVPQYGEAMSRLPSQDSVGAHSYRSSNSYDETSSASIFPSHSQKSFHLSSARSDISGRSNSPDSSALYTPTQQPIDLQSFDHFPYPVGEDFNGNHSIYHRGDFKLDLPLTETSYNMFATTTDETFAPMAAVHGPIAHESLIYNSLTESPVWDGSFPDSQSSSPMLEEEWNLPTLPSTTSSPQQYSPSLDYVSPENTQDFQDMDLPLYTTDDRIVKKPVGPRPSKVAGDMARNRFAGTSEQTDESIRFEARAGIDMDNTARDHALYQNVTVHADGLYHCPWEGKEVCTHKPEKLKCNYE
jgi:hypothetical protein